MPSFSTAVHASSQEFELTINIEKLIREVDKDGSGFVDFEEFKLILA